MKAFEELLEIMRALRDPESGCDWIRAQTMATILPFTLEETYELMAAVEEGDEAGIRDELADLLYHIVYYAQMAAEQGLFDISDVARHARGKLVDRHPHVFRQADAARGPAAWERRKRGRRDGAGRGLLHGVPLSQPALIAAAKLQKRAAGAGFDWDELAPVLDKIGEEVDEIRAELDAGGDRQRLEDEFGDLLFACVNAARHAGIEPEAALRRTNRKFLRRFGYIESRLRERGLDPDDASLEEMDALWQEAKGGEE